MRHLSLRSRLSQTLLPPPRATYQQVLQQTHSSRITVAMGPGDKAQLCPRHSLQRLSGSPTNANGATSTRSSGPKSHVTTLVRRSTSAPSYYRTLLCMVTLSSTISSMQKSMSPTRLLGSCVVSGPWQALPEGADTFPRQRTATPR